jgi:hypothetical protein
MLRFVSRLEGRDEMLEAVRWQIADSQEAHRSINYLFVECDAGSAEPVGIWFCVGE